MRAAGHLPGVRPRACHGVTLGDDQNRRLEHREGFGRSLVVADGFSDQGAGAHDLARVRGGDLTGRERRPYGREVRVDR